MEIAIVDDQVSDLTTLENLLIKYFISKHLRVNINKFTSAESFLTAFTPNFFDIVFLDIYMAEMTGMELAEKLVILDENCNIIFLTSSPDFILDGYNVHAINYLLKPISSNSNSLFKSLEYIQTKISNVEKKIIIETNKLPKTIFLKDILYIECEKTGVKFKLYNDEIFSPKPYSFYAPFLLEQPNFLECYHKIIVNCDYIIDITENDFILKTNELIPISRRKKTSVKHSYMLYLISK